MLGKLQNGAMAGSVGVPVVPCTCAPGPISSELADTSSALDPFASFTVSPMTPYPSATVARRPSRILPPTSFATTPPMMVASLLNRASRATANAVGHSQTGRVVAVVLVVVVVVVDVVDVVVDVVVVDVVVVVPGAQPCTR